MCLLKLLNIYLWKYKFSHKFYFNYRECSWCNKQEISGYRGNYI